MSSTGSPGPCSSSWPQLRTLHLAFADITAKDMLDQCVFAPVHAGAARYFREAGLKPPRRCLPK